MRRKGDKARKNADGLTPMKLTPMPKRWPLSTKDPSGEKVDLAGGMRGYLRGMGAYL